MTPIECQTRLSVLVLGEDTRSFLTVVRSLGKAGFDVYVVCYLRNSPALKSQYIKQAFFYNYQSSTPEDWNSEVLALIHRYQFDLVLPCDERAAYPLCRCENPCRPAPSSGCKPPRDTPFCQQMAHQMPCQALSRPRLTREALYHHRHVF